MWRWTIHRRLPKLRIDPGFLELWRSNTTQIYQTPPQITNDPLNSPRYKKQLASSEPTSCLAPPNLILCSFVLCGGNLLGSVSKGSPLESSFNPHQMYRAATFVSPGTDEVSAASLHRLRAVLCNTLACFWWAKASPNTKRIMPERSAS